MLRLPNKLYPFAESTLACFPLVLTAIGDQRMRVTDVYNDVAEDINVNDFIDCVTMLLAIQEIELDAKQGVVWRA